MAAKNTILGKLNSKKVELVNASQASLDAAAYHESQVEGLRTSAAADTKKAAAVEKALNILNEAGVVV